MDNSGICEFIINYNTDNDYIKLDTLVVTQSNILMVLRLIQREIYPEDEILIKVKNTQPGSFGLSELFEIVRVGLPLAPAIFTGSNIQIARELFKYIDSILKLKIFLKGKEPEGVKQEGNNITVIGDNNKVFNINGNVYDIIKRDIKLDQALRETFRELEGDDSIKGIDVIVEKEKVIEAKKEEFKYIADKNRCLNEEEGEEIVDVRLAIIKPILDSKKKWKWGFIYNGRTINAYVKDEDFIKRVEESRVKFGHGDVLEVKMKIVKKYDKELTIYIEDSFEIIEVKNIHIILEIFGLIYLKWILIYML